MVKPRFRVSNARVDSLWNIHLLSFPSDGVVTVTVEDNTIITYNDPEPIEVNYLGFGTFYGDVQYYYNCTKSTNGDAMPSHAKK